MIYDDPIVIICSNQIDFYEIFQFVTILYIARPRSLV